jgi:hypothetical protein
MKQNHLVGFLHGFQHGFLVKRQQRTKVDDFNIDTFLSPVLSAASSATYTMAPYVITEMSVPFDAGLLFR